MTIATSITYTSLVLRWSVNTGESWGRQKMEKGGVLGCFKALILSANCFRMFWKAVYYERSLFVRQWCQNEAVKKVRKKSIFLFLGFDTGWCPAYKPQTRRRSCWRLLSEGFGTKYFLGALFEIVRCYERDSWVAMFVWMSSCAKNKKHALTNPEMNHYFKASALNLAHG